MYRHLNVTSHMTNIATFLKLNYCEMRQIVYTLLYDTTLLSIYLEDFMREIRLNKTIMRLDLL